MMELTRFPLPRRHQQHRQSRMLSYWQKRAEQLEKTLSQLDEQLEKLKLDNREHFKALQECTSISVLNMRK